MLRRVAYTDDRLMQTARCVRVTVSTAAAAAAQPPTSLNDNARLLDC